MAPPERDKLDQALSERAGQLKRLREMKHHEASCRGTLWEAVFVIDETEREIRSSRLKALRDRLLGTLLEERGSRARGGKKGGLILGRSGRGFTLIELLIVVAIVAILAAVAVPNFLEAQTRSKIARTHSDLRSLELALDVYRADANGYPVVPSLYYPLGARFAQVTSPIAYIGTPPADPFAKVDFSGDLSGGEPFYCYASGNLYAGGSPQYDKPIYWNSLYSLAGRGPDGTIVFGGYCMAHPVAIRGQAPVRGSYDPTNGTISAGDILRLGPGRIDDF